MIRIRLVLSVRSPAEPRIQLVGILVEVIDTAGVEAAGAALDAVYQVALLQKQLSQVGAVLPRDPCNQCGFARCWHLRNSAHFFNLAQLPGAPMDAVDTETPGPTGLWLGYAISALLRCCSPLLASHRLLQHNDPDFRAMQALDQEWLGPPPWANRAHQAPKLPSPSTCWP